MIKKDLQHTWVVNALPSICRADWVISLLILLTVSRRVVFWPVTAKWKNGPLLHFFTSPGMALLSFITTLSDLPSPLGRQWSFSRYGSILQMYLDLESRTTQKLIPNLSGLVGLYCRKQQRVFDGNCWLPMVMCCRTWYSLWQTISTGHKLRQNYASLLAPGMWTWRQSRDVARCPESRSETWFQWPVGFHAGLTSCPEVKEPRSPPCKMMTAINAFCLGRAMNQYSCFVSCFK